MKPNSLCDNIKAKTSLRAIATLLNIDLPADGRKFRSPFRPDKSPSCSVKENVLTDWSTGERFDQIDFFAAAKNLPRAEAIRGLAQSHVVRCHPPPR